MAAIIRVLLISLLITNSRSVENTSEYMVFPSGFKLGVSTSSYQIEGGWKASDKGRNVWDRFTHEKPSPIADGSNGDVACDSYNKYKEDIALLSDLGVDAYRISLSWARILPKGFANEVSVDGIRYYKNLLDDLISQEIEPFVTIYHWDHPAVLEDMGGWTNELMVQWFADYARVVFENLGDRVKMFVTINEPMTYCNMAYSRHRTAPGSSIPGIAPYICVHNMLKAHAMAYRLYDEEFRMKQNGFVGVGLACTYFYPHPNENETIARVAFDFRCGWAIEPIFSSEGDYPEIMKKRIEENSKLEGYPRSRLPSFTEQELKMIKGSADFFGLNHYTSSLTRSTSKSKSTLHYEDSGIIESSDSSWPSSASFWLKSVPEGFGDLLREIKRRYGNNVPIYVLENGWSDDGSNATSDPSRIRYHHDYIREMLLAVNRDGCNVKGYFVWSLLDSFEWQRGYLERFGLVSVDFRDENRPRTPKDSFNWYKGLIRSRKLPPPASTN